MNLNPGASAPERGNGAAFKAVTENSCSLCAPLGAVLAFAGIEGCMSLLHGSQGCSTYIRRYLISHFREPLDVASSNFSEESAVFGGEPALKTALDNVSIQYRPRLIAVASTCLAETMGEDLDRILSSYERERLGSEELGAAFPGGLGLPELAWASTPSYAGTHRDGFRLALLSIAKRFALRGGEPAASGFPVLAISPGMHSPSDLRWIKSLGPGMGFEAVLLSDWSERLDGPPWEAYSPIPPGGTPIEAIGSIAGAAGAIDLACVERGDPGSKPGAAAWLGAELGIESRFAGQPIGVEATDEFIRLLGEIGAGPPPEAELAARGRLIDAYFDAHKYASGLRAAVFGEEDLSLALAAFIQEMGADCVLAATGDRGGGLGRGLSRAGIAPEAVIEDADYRDIEEAARGAGAEIIIGNGKAAKLARNLDIPLVRVGMPIHDRFGASRVRLLGYEGSLSLLDSIVNAALERRQARSRVGYSYL